MMASDHLIFDLDGTISDPAVGICRSMNYALTHFGYAEIRDAEVSAFIGPPIDVTFRALTQSDSHQHIAALVTRFRERYSDVGYSENSLYAGIEDALKGLLERGARLGLCTSKRSDFAEKILAMFGLLRRFEFVCGGDVGISKSAQLSQLVRDRVTGQGSTMIGDRAIDILAGKANGLRSVGVLWGHGSEAELRDVGADRILSNPFQLSELVDAPDVR
jgi:phosphoglycolate phosphatase